jgi:hypothetical protein
MTTTILLRQITTVIPGRAKGATPESRNDLRIPDLDSGLTRYARAPE